MSKVRNGTRSDKIHLCQRCVRGTIIRGAAESQELTFCGQIERFLSYRVAECTKFCDKAAVSIHDMADAAWILRSNKSGPMGFMRASEWRRDNKGQNILPPGTDD